LVKQTLHLTDRLLDASDNRSSDDTVADIELGHFRDLCDSQNIVIVQAVAAVNLQSETLR
jgi:hypothetical protein